VRLYSGFDGALAVSEADGEFDLILKRRKRRDSGQVIQKGPQSLLEPQQVRGRSAAAQLGA
jgi:hypothetical protein